VTIVHHICFFKAWGNAVVVTIVRLNKLVAWGLSHASASECQELSLTSEEVVVMCDRMGEQVIRGKLWYHLPIKRRTKSTWCNW
jgi:hypothetical protein